jgi:hypothetical protein
MDVTKRRKWRFRVTVMIALIAMVTTGAALASNQAYTLDWWTVDGGGWTSSGGNYTLGGTIGQPDAGVMQGGAYTLVGGFWGGTLTEGDYEIYLPAVIR